MLLRISTIKNKFTTIVNEAIYKVNKMKNINPITNKEDTYKHLNFRKINLPNNIHKKLRLPYANKFKSGEFKLNIYVDLKIGTKIEIAIKNILKSSKIAIILTVLFTGLAVLTTYVLEQPFSIPYAGKQILILAYTYGLVKGVSKTSDNFAYYNSLLSVGKSQINKLTLDWMKKGTNLSNPEEFKVLEKYRNKYNKYLLFPTIKELAVIEQMYVVAQINGTPEEKKSTAKRRNTLSIISREIEHLACREIANIKQEANGGTNEYDLLVSKYKNRTNEELRQTAKSLHSNYENLSL